MTRAAFALLALVSAAAASAADLAVLPVEAVNLSRGEADAIGVLVSNALAAESGRPVAGPADTAAAMEREGGLGPALGALGARAYVRVNAVRLASRIQVAGALHDAAGGAVRQADITAANLDDVEPAARRLARALLRGITTDEARDLRTVTAREGQRPNRVFTSKAIGVKTGITWPTASGVDFDPSISFQFDARLEGERWFLEFGAGALLPATSGGGRGFGGVFAEIGGSAYLSDTSTAPYVGAGVRPAILFTLDDGGTNLGLYGQVGIAFLREYRSRLYVEVRALRNLVDFKDARDPFVDRQVGISEFALQAGIGW